MSVTVDDRDKPTYLYLDGRAVEDINPKSKIKLFEAGQSHKLETEVNTFLAGLGGLANVTISACHHSGGTTYLALVEYLERR